MRSGAGCARCRPRRATAYWRDAVRRVIDRKAFGELDQRRLAGGVGGAAGDADLAKLRGDVDDAAAARLRISGTAYLHIRNAPVRLTASASCHSSSVRFSTVPSGVTAAATLTSAVSLPKASPHGEQHALRPLPPWRCPDGDGLPASGNNLACDHLCRITPDWPPQRMRRPRQTAARSRRQSRRRRR